MITVKMIKEWHGSDGSYQDLCEYLAYVLNGNNERLEECKNEILVYSEVENANCKK